MRSKLFKNKNFMLLIAGKTVSLVGSNMQQFALSLYVLAITGSATIFASILAISIIPRLILSPVAGVFGDWFDRKKSIVIIDFINGLVIGIVAIYFIYNKALSLPIIYALVIILEITEIFFNSAMAAVIPSIVEKDELMEANSLKSIVNNIGNILAPLIAAFLYVNIGLKIIFILNSISFILSAISEIFIDIPKNNKKPEQINFKEFKNDFVDGIKIIKNSRLISAIIGLGTVLNFCMSPLFSVGLIFVIKEILKCSDYQFSLFQVILSSSMLLSPIICSKILKQTKISKLIINSFLITGGLAVLMSIIPTTSFFNVFKNNLISYICITFLSFLIGVVVTAANIGISTLFQEIVPLEYMGRTATTMNLGLTISIPIGQILFGVLYDTLPPYIPISVAGIIVIIFVFLFKDTLLNAKKSLVTESDIDNIVCE